MWSNSGLNENYAVGNGTWSVVHCLTVFAWTFVLRSERQTAAVGLFSNTYATGEWFEFREFRPPTNHPRARCQCLVPTDLFIWITHFALLSQHPATWTVIWIIIYFVWFIWFYSAFQKKTWHANLNKVWVCELNRQITYLTIACQTCKFPIGYVRAFFQRWQLIPSLTLIPFGCLPIRSDWRPTSCRRCNQRYMYCPQYAIPKHVNASHLRSAIVRIITS